MIFFFIPFFLFKVAFIQVKLNHKIIGLNIFSHIDFHMQQIIAHFFYLKTTKICLRDFRLLYKLCIYSGLKLKKIKGGIESRKVTVAFCRRFFTTLSNI